MGLVLIYQIGALGDTIVSIPAYRAVRRHFVGDEIRLLEAELEPGRVQPSEMLLKEGLIDGSTTYPHQAGGGGKRDLFQLWKAAFLARPKCVVYIGPAERPPKVVERDKRFFRSCFVKTLVGFHGIDYTQFDKRDSDGNYLPMPMQAQLRLDRLAKDGLDVRQDDLKTPLLHVSTEDRAKKLEWIEARRSYPGRKLVMMGVGSAQHATKWPVDRFEELGQRIVDSKKAEIVIVGGPAEKKIGEDLTRRWGEGIVAAGEFSVVEMGALMTLADLYIGLDTGTSHLAGAVGAPVIGLYSEHHPPHEWEPMGTGHTILRHRVPCQVCRSTVCNVQGHPCMTGITVDQVWDALQARMP